MQAIPLRQVRALIRGATDFEEAEGVLTPLRLPRWTRARQFDQWIERWSALSLGVSLVTHTAATRLELDLLLERVLPSADAHEVFPASMVVEIEGEVVARVALDGGTVVRTLPDRTARIDVGAVATVVLELGGSVAPREVRVWFPHNGRVELHAVRADASLERAGEERRPRWVHHGSSVSHGLEARDPLGPWPQQAARALGVEITDLAIAGNAQLDPFVAQTIAAVDADIVSLKLGVNTVNADSMRARAFVPALHGFLDIVRAGHPDTPILVLSPIACPAIESVPGPTVKLADGRYRGTPQEVTPGDGKLTLRRVRDLIRAVIETRRETDPLLWYEDGLELFGEGDAELLWDGLHPDQRGYDLIARRFVERADGEGPVGEAFAAARSRTPRS